jgi:hypothetical protein
MAVRVASQAAVPVECAAPGPRGGPAAWVAPRYADLAPLAAYNAGAWLWLARLQAAIGWLMLRVRRPGVLRALPSLGSGTWATLVHVEFARLVCRRPRRSAWPGPPIALEGHLPEPGEPWIGACLPSVYAAGVAERGCELLDAVLVTKPSWGVRAGERHRASGVGAFREQLRTLAAGGRVVVPLLIDDRGDVPLAFLDRRARVISAPARLALLADVPLRALTVRLAPGGVRVWIGPPRRASAEDGGAAAFARLAADVEPCVRAWPPSWTRILYFLRRHPAPGT